MAGLTNKWRGLRCNENGISLGQVKHPNVFDIRDGFVALQFLQLGDLLFNPNNVVFDNGKICFEIIGLMILHEFFHGMGHSVKRKADLVGYV
jgi:hypothetical protein